MSSMQTLLYDTFRASRKRIGTSAHAYLFSDYGVQYGINYGRAYLNHRMNCRAVVVCGGCVNGQISVKTSDGIKTNEKATHEDCQGTGYRINKRYGVVRKFRKSKKAPIESQEGQ